MQRKFCHQPQHTVDSLEKRLHTDGGSCRICLQPPTRRFSSLHGHQEWIMTFSTRPSNGGLVYLPLRRQVLPVRSIALWMGQIATLVHSLHVGIRPGVAPLEYSGATLSRRLLDSAVESWNRFNTRSLPTNHQPDRCPPSSVGSRATSHQGRMDRHPDSCSPRSGDRYCCHAFQSLLLQASSDKAGCQGYPPSSPSRKALGEPASSVSFLRSLRLTFFTHAMGQILYPFVVLGHVETPTTGSKRAMQVKASRHSRPAEMARSFKNRAER